MSTPLAPAAAGSLSVGSLNQASKHKRSFDAIISLQDPKAKPKDKLTFHYGAPAHWLVIEAEDFDHADRGVMVATTDQVSEILAFGREHAVGSLLVHCMHGVGRSAAAALAILADRMGPGNEAAAYAQLLASRPEITPNLVIVAIADDLLGRNGALVAAVAEGEAANPAKGRMRETRLAFYEADPSLYAHHPA